MGCPVKLGEWAAPAGPVVKAGIQLASTSNWRTRPPFRLRLISTLGRGALGGLAARVEMEDGAARPAITISITSRIAGTLPMVRMGLKEREAKPGEPKHRAIRFQCVSNSDPPVSVSARNSINQMEEISEPNQSHDHGAYLRVCRRGLHFA